MVIENPNPISLEYPTLLEVLKKNWLKILKILSIVLRKAFNQL